MRIQHNIMAMNAYRNFSNNTSALSKNLEKLSSGYKINRAGDDAAGLAISEKMRAQITGLETAQKNAKDGISLIQTAEGALTEVHDMLNRMVELADQSANGTYDNETDRANLQKEFDALRTEIDRIADSSNFNGIKLLDGSLAKSETVAEIETAQQMVTIKGNDAGVPGFVTGQTFVEAKGAVTKFAQADVQGNDSNYDYYEISFTDKDGKNHTLKLLETDKTGIGSGADTLAAALNGGGGLEFAAAGKGQDEALKALKDTFTITGDSGSTLNFEVKDPAGLGSFGSLKRGTHATGTNEAIGAVADVDVDSTTAATKAGYELTLKGSPAAGDTLVIGGKTYEFSANTTDALNNKNAVRVVAGSAAVSHENLLNALKADGFEVEATASGTLLFTNPSQLMEDQAGAQVSTSASNLNIANQDAVKQSTEITYGVGTTPSTTATMTINYIDAEGKAQSKQLSYATSNVAATNGKNMYEALRNDEELASLFNFEDDGTKITVTAKGTDTSVGQFLGFNSSDDATTTTAIDTVTTTAGKDDGKTIELKDTTQNLTAGDKITVNGKTYEFAATTSDEIGEGNTRILLGSDGKASLENLSKALTDDGIRHNFDAATGKITLADKDNAPPEVVEKEGGLTLQIGDTSESFNKMTVSVNDMHAKALGLADLSIADQDSASDAVEAIKAAINSVSSTRGDLGAFQNRLEHTINNLSVMQENIQDAEATIRDTDVAAEMMEYTKNNILIQSAQAMLAQANQVPQGVLQLLQ